MSTLRTVLQKSDPLVHEVPRLDAERDRMRQAILAAARNDRPIGGMRSRLRLLGPVAAALIGFAVVGYQIWVNGTTPVFAAVRFDVRLAEEQPMPGLVVAQLADSGRVIYLHPEIVASNDDIAQAWVVQDGPDRFGVSVRFLPTGAERMKQATTRHLGRPMAVLIDDAVVMAPVLRSPIADSAVISGHFTQAQAERIADGIARR